MMCGAQGAGTGGGGMEPQCRCRPLSQAGAAASAFNTAAHSAPDSRAHHTASQRPSEFCLSGEASSRRHCTMHTSRTPPERRRNDARTGMRCDIRSYVGVVTCGSTALVKPIELPMPCWDTESSTSVCVNGSILSWDHRELHYFFFASQKNIASQQNM